jgi:hypothetical protein
MANKTILLPADDPDAAHLLLKEWLDKDDKVLFIVLGDTEIARETVRKADGFTGDADEARWVVHAPVREDVVDLLKDLEDPKGLVDDWEKPLSIATSLRDVIRDMIVRDGKVPNNTRIVRSFMLAEKKEQP